MWATSTSSSVPSLGGAAPVPEGISIESMRPLAFVGSQIMVFLRPLVSLVWPAPGRWDQLQRVLEVRGATELLARRLEARM